MDIVERLRSRRVDVSEVDIAEAADLIDRLRAEVAKHQESEFHPDWSMLEATRASLREHMEIIRGLRAELAFATQERNAYQDAVDVACEERDRLRAELASYKAAAPLCEEHKPNGGTRGNCLLCGLIKQSSALSRIDYLCGEPNDMEVSGYDVHCNEEVVVENVRKMNVELAEKNDALQFVERWTNHHGQKPTCTTEAALSCIQHYPAIKEITLSYADGKVPETPNPWAERDRLRELLKRVVTFGIEGNDVLADINAELGKETPNG